MTNKYEAHLIEELKEHLGDDACKADWDEFWDTIVKVNESASVHARFIEEHDDDLIEEAVDLVYEWAQDTRADLPSIKAYIWQQIENETGK